MDTSAPIGKLFLACAGHAAEVIASSTVAARWDEPSVLANYTVGGLCGHLLRAVSTVDGYLDRTPATDGTPLDAADGPAALVSTLRSTLEALGSRVDDAALTHSIEVRDGISMTVDEYLRTQLVELVVHLDDRKASIDMDDAAALPDAAYVEVAGVLGRFAALRVGGLAVVRSLARRERHEAAVRAL